MKIHAAHLPGFSVTDEVDEVFHIARHAMNRTVTQSYIIACTEFVR